MPAEIIPLPHAAVRASRRLTGDTALRMVRYYETAIALGLRAELHTALGAHARAHRCRRAVARLRQLAFGNVLRLLPPEDLPAFADRIVKRAPPAAPPIFSGASETSLSAVRRERSPPS